MEVERKLLERIELDSHSYLNIDLRNDPNYDQPAFQNLLQAQFFETKQKNIIKNSREYHLAISRFNVPIGNIPLFIFRIQEGPAQANINLGIYQITLRFNNQNFSEYITYNPTTPGLNLPNPPSLNSGKQNTTAYYYNFKIQPLLNMFNTSLSTQYTLLKAAYPGTLTTEAPFFWFNPETKLIKLYCEDAYSLANEVEIWINQPSQFLFEGFDLEFFGELTRYYKFEVYTNPIRTNGFNATHIYMEQLNQTISKYTSFKKIVFKTSLIPIRLENASYNNESGISVDEPILTDYVISDWLGDRENFIFFNRGPYRFIDLVSDNPIKSINIQVFWEDELNVLRLIDIFPGNTLNIKLAFIIKGLSN